MQSDSFRSCIVISPSAFKKHPMFNECPPTPELPTAVVFSTFKKADPRALRIPGWPLCLRLKIMHGSRQRLQRSLPLGRGSLLLCMCAAAAHPFAFLNIGPLPQTRHSVSSLTQNSKTCSGGLQISGSVSWTRAMVTTQKQLLQGAQIHRLGFVPVPRF